MIRRLALCCAVWPAALAAHPHIFVDTGLMLEVDEAGTLTAVEVTWAYDEFYSLLIFEDMGLDPEMDGALTEAELERLEGFDLNWSEGFEGDLYLSRGEEPIPLGPPEALSTEVKDGVITTRHRRLVSPTAPVAAQGVTVRAYDPSYYTAYEINGGVKISGNCIASLTPPDLDAAYTQVEELLYAIPADQANDLFPEVGRAFATTVSLDCGG